MSANFHGIFHQVLFLSSKYFKMTVTNMYNGKLIIIVFKINGIKFSNREESLVSA